LKKEGSYNEGKTFLPLDVKENLSYWPPLKYPK